MAQSSSISNTRTNSNPSPKNRRKTGTQPSAPTSTESGRPRWRTEAEQQIYSSNLIDALRNLQRPESAAVTGRSVRDAADRVLAVSAKGKTRWSRAILTGRLSLRLAQINRKHKKAAKPDAGLKKLTVQKKRPIMQRKVKALSRLVPGCRKLSLPNLLEETADYLAALEMQVKALTYLTGLLNGAVAESSGGLGSVQAQYFSST